VELYGRVRHAVLVDGMSRREAARVFGINRRTVEKMLTFSIPPGYRRGKEIRRPKLDGFTGIIDQILDADKLVPKKQRHTSKRVFERLRDEHRFTGGITIVKDYIFAAKRRQREMFVPPHPDTYDAAHSKPEEALVIYHGESMPRWLARDLMRERAAVIEYEAGLGRKEAQALTFQGLECSESVSL
jgi:Psq-like protein